MSFAVSHSFSLLPGSEMFDICALWACNSWRLQHFFEIVVKLFSDLHLDLYNKKQSSFVIRVIRIVTIVY